MPIMETVGKKKPRHRRSFTPEFKAEIVDACNRGDRSIGQVARDFDLTETAVREWVKQADIDAGRRDGLTSAEREELAQLRRENRQLRRTWESSVGQRHSSPRRSGERVAVHRGGGSGAAQRQARL
jgi:transposase